MNKKQFLFVAIGLVLVCSIITFKLTSGTRPFNDLSENDIVEVTVELFPPDIQLTDGQEITIYDQINEHITIPSSMDSCSFEILNGNHRIIWNANADVLIYSPESHKPIKLDIWDALYESVMDEKRYGDVDYYVSGNRGMFCDLFFYQTDSKLYFAYEEENASDISTTCVISVDLSTYEISNVKAFYNVGLLDAAFDTDTVTLVMMDNPIAGNTPYFTVKLSTSSFNEIE